MLDFFRKPEYINPVPAQPSQPVDPYAAVRDGAIAIDWKRLNAFAVERNVCDGFPVTIVSFHLKSEQVIHGIVVTSYETKEWFFHCSEATHQRLVDEFNKTRS